MTSGDGTEIFYYTTASQNFKGFPEKLPAEKPSFRRPPGREKVDRVERAERGADSGETGFGRAAEIGGVVERAVIEQKGKRPAIENEGQWIQPPAQRPGPPVGRTRTRPVPATGRWGRCPAPGPSG